MRSLHGTDRLGPPPGTTASMEKPASMASANLAERVADLVNDVVGRAVLARRTNHCSRVRVSSKRLMNGGDS
ncbi:hypothetical protein D3C78_1749820 [compost metagenome]